MPIQAKEYLMKVRYAVNFIFKIKIMKKSWETWKRKWAGTIKTLKLRVNPANKFFILFNVSLVLFISIHPILLPEGR